MHHKSRHSLRLSGRLTGNSRALRQWVWRSWPIGARIDNRGCHVPIPECVMSAVVVPNRRECVRWLQHHAGRISSARGLIA
jgi:hypothetical protein